MKNFDAVVIGGGPGGVTAGMMLTAMGKSVAMVQTEHDAFGGVCLNRGCMPTKALLKAATAYRYATQGEKYGLDLSAGPVDLKRLRAVADADLDKLRGMIRGSIDPSPAETFRGLGSFATEHEIKITRTDGSGETIRGEQIIIATGSESVELPFARFDGKYILSSDQMLQNTELPGKLLIVGGGAIGCEFATLYNTFGSEVTLVEAFDTLLPREDAEAGIALATAFENQGISVKTGTMIEALSVENSQVVVKYKGNDTSEIVDKVLVGVGRKPNVGGLNLDAVGVEVENGAIKVTPAMQTSVSHIFALGDVTGGLMLAHAAEKAGAVLAMNMAKGTSASLDENGVPRVVFSYPEVAAIGVSKAEDGMKSFTLSPVPNGRSVVDKVAPAFIKLFAEEETSVITGGIIIGEAATEMIHELALAVDNRLPLEQFGSTVHAHPTHSTNLVKAVHHFQYQA